MRFVHLPRTYPLSLLCVAAVWYLSLFKPPSIGIANFAGSDKVVHALMYFGICITMWWEYRKSHACVDWWRTAAAFIVAPILMSGTIELLQEYATAYRSGDWWDLAANSFGVTVAAIAGNTLLPAWLKRRKRP